MRIISDFRDFYDCMQRSDGEREPLWLRNPVTEEFKPEKYPLPRMPDPHGRIWTIQRIIGFCGKIFPFLEMHDSRGAYGSRTVLCADPESIDRFIKEDLPQDYQDDFFAPPRSGRGFWLGLRRQVVRDWFAECGKKSGSFGDLFARNRSPVFVASFPGKGLGGDATMTFNASLKGLGFQKVFPPAQAYQEIRMFLDNMAVPHKPLPKLDDITLAEAKGFDKFSFRKDPIRKRR